MCPSTRERYLDDDREVVAARQRDRSPPTGERLRAANRERAAAKAPGGVTVGRRASSCRRPRTRGCEAPEECPIDQRGGSCYQPRGESCYRRKRGDSYRRRREVCNPRRGGSCYRRKGRSRYGRRGGFLIPKGVGVLAPKKRKVQLLK